MTDESDRPIRLCVAADQVDMDDDIAVISLTVATAEDFSRRFLRSVLGEETTEADE